METKKKTKVTKKVVTKEQQVPLRCPHAPAVVPSPLSGVGLKARNQRRSYSALTCMKSAHMVWDPPSLTKSQVCSSPTTPLQTSTSNTSSSSSSAGEKEEAADRVDGHHTAGIFIATQHRRSSECCGPPFLTTSDWIRLATREQRESADWPTSPPHRTRRVTFVDLPQEEDGKELCPSSVSSSAPMLEATYPQLASEKRGKEEEKGKTEQPPCPASCECPPIHGQQSAHLLKKCSGTSKAKLGTLPVSWSLANLQGCRKSSVPAMRLSN